MLNILYFYDFLFQSSLPRGERPPFPLFCLPVVSDFNPRSREGSDTLPRSRFPGTVISILAPARGATACIIGMSDCPIVISILAPARGATLSQRFRTVTWLIFQSSLPRGERLSSSGVIRVVHIVHFNPRSREGSDGGDYGIELRYGKFQSSLPRGERR